MPNRDSIRSQAPVTEPKMASSPAQQAPVKAPGAIAKINAGKGIREAMSPPAPDPERTELLGSLTTQQQQRTSARVIKKLRLEPPAGKCKSETECETPSKIDEKDLKFPTVKQRMPKALWSTDEKNLFFEALNEYGKDFDAITAYICAKMKKKGMPDGNLKTKTQVSHFYYRTWHKLSKHVHFDENVKKVAQELYALINYGELRKKLVAVNEKTCARLGEMVLGGSMVVRARGKNVRVRTPMCRALRKLNQITGCVVSRVCWRCTVWLRARSAGGWARVQAAAHNPRLRAAAAARTKLSAFLAALEARWAPRSSAKLERLSESSCAEEGQKETEDCLERACEEDERDDLENHLNLETDRLIVQEQRQPKKQVLHVGPHPEAEIHLPLVRASEQLSTHKICLSSYLERVAPRHAGDTAAQAKIRTPKRQRKDSATEKDKDAESKKLRVEESDMKLINIDETAIDGIELMANFKSQLEDDEKPSTEDEKELKSEETAEEEVENIAERDKDTDKEMLERDKDMSEREKDSFSEMEDDEKYNKSDEDDESDHGKEKSGKEGKFKNLKVKFRIRPKKRGGSMYTLVLDKDHEEPKAEEAKSEEQPEELETAVRQVRRGWSRVDAGDLTLGDLYLMFGSRSRLELDYWWAEPTPPLPRAPVSLTPPAPERDSKAQRTPDKEDDARESDTDIFSPKAFGHDSNDGLSGDERKSEQLASPDHKAPSSGCGASLKLVSKLVNRPTPPPPSGRDNGFAQLSDRLKRLLALAGNPHVNCTAPAVSRCSCGHVCAHTQRRPAPAQKPQTNPTPRNDDNYALFRHPTPIAPRPDTEAKKALSLEGLPPLARGRRRPERRVVVQRLLPLLPKLPPAASTNLIPVKIVPSAPAPRLLPKPAPIVPSITNTSAAEKSCFYVLSESNGQFYFHDGDKRIPITPPPGMTPSEAEDQDEDVEGTNDDKTNDTNDLSLNESVTKDDAAENDGGKSGNPDIANFLPGESMSLSPSRLLRDSETWMGSVQDFSLSSFLHHLETRQELGVDSQLQSLMAESSVDYVAKFADLAAEVTGEANPLPSNETPYNATPLPSNEMPYETTPLPSKELPYETTQLPSNEMANDATPLPSNEMP